MTENFLKKISWLSSRPKILNYIFRGIERETLRIQKNGNFSNFKHPYLIGSSLTHKWITTDFSENLLEFITPVSKDIDYLLFFLKDLHSFVACHTKNERIWPFSIPYFYNGKKNIPIAQYGHSNIGKMKNIYRIGLKKRYGDAINTIAGVHYNFSLPVVFWKEWNKQQKNQNDKDYISNGYLHLIRNYYRFGWIIPYLFGASPAMPEYFLKNTKINYVLKKNKENILYSPWSTSLRLSDIGYTNTSIIDLRVMFNDVKSYIKLLKSAIKTPSEKFTKLGLKDEKGNFQQLNTNTLQIESELYTQIRPKRKTDNGESLVDALKNRGIEYIEVRSLDINPFSSIGINKNQILFLDLFLIWCTLIDSPKINKEDIFLIKKNWEKIIFEGRKPNQKIYINSNNETKTLVEIGQNILKDLSSIAKILDSSSNNSLYYDTCKEKMLYFKYPELTYSGQCLKILMKEGIKKKGLSLCELYHKNFINRSFVVLNKKILDKEAKRSHLEQEQIEKNDSISFEEYLKQNNLL